MSGVAPPTVRERRMSTTVNANIRVPAGPSVMQQQYTELLQNDVNLPMNFTAASVV